MEFFDFTQKKWWKEFIHKLYSWGASVVLIGALFKITHWPGANIMLTIGLTTEAVIFFFSGIEPAPEELDWTLVYPELAGVTEEDELDVLSSKSKRRHRGEELPAASVEAISKLDAMLEKAGEQGLFEKLHDGLSKFSENLDKLHDITDATLATKEFADNVKKAGQNVYTSSEEVSNTLKDASNNFNNTLKDVSGHISNLGNAYEQSAQEAKSLAEGIKNSAQSVSYSLDNFADAVSKKMEALGEIDFSVLTDGNKTYNEQISQLNKNLSAINAIFEMQLGEANLDQMVKDISDSAEHAKKYSQEIAKLSRNLEALNEVYGRMLSALNVKLD